MSDEPQDRKTEAPTRRRLDEARRDGQIARSRDVGGAAVLTSVLIGLWVSRGWMAELARDLLRFALDVPRWLDDSATVNAATAIAAFGHAVALASAVPVGLAVVAALLVGVIQTRGLFSPNALVSKFDRINPVQGAKRVFALRNLVELLKSIMKIAVLGGALFLVIRATLPALVRLPNLTAERVAVAAAELFEKFFSITLAALALIAIFDAWFQRADFLRRLRMTKEEVKRERRDDEGDPHMAGRRRALIREAAHDSPLERSAHASLVVTSAAEDIAVALFVDAGASVAPWLLHKGRAHGARAIVRVARENEVRVIDDARLARLIYAETGTDADVAPRIAQEIRRLFN